jgi:hypothetical protein
VAAATFKHVKNIAKIWQRRSFYNYNTTYDPYKWNREKLPKSIVLGDRT